jgi:GNAT superfamily N-acetyltransferase
VNLVIRRARDGDQRTVLRLVRALATFEREPESVKATEDSVRETLFERDAQVSAYLAEIDGEPVGLALWFLTYSTWTGRPSLYLEDLFVDEKVRGQGVARALMQRLAKEAKRRNCARIDWAVLDWNTEAMAFYEKLGGRRQIGWQPWRLQGDALDRMAEQG